MPKKTQLKVPSVPILVSRISKWFHKNNYSIPIFWTSGVLDLPKFPDESEHLVLMADMIPKYLIHLKNGKLNPHYLWVLCTSVKNIFVNYLHFPEKAVHVIPRYEIFPNNKNCYSIEESEYFIYSGRLIKEKNLFQSIRTVSVLRQQKAFKNHTLQICYPKFEIPPKSLLEIANANKWVHLSGDLGTSWTKKIKPRPAGIFLSQYQYEDFGVSIAQLQSSLGAPLILSPWMGHLDVTGQSIYELNPRRQLSNAELNVSLTPKSKQTNIVVSPKPILMDRDTISKISETANNRPVPYRLTCLFFDSFSATSLQPAFSEITKHCLS